MQIGRTNASAGGGTTKSPYELWQEGFGANWDDVIQNSPSTGVNPALHIYNKVNSIRHLSNFSTNITIVTYNPTTGVYRPVTVDTNKNLFFEESDYFINNNDGMYYCCVIYKTPNYWGDWYFRNYLPIVYSNTKFCTSESYDFYISLITDTVNLYPFLRGVDCYNLTDIRISGWLEHLTVAVCQPTININAIKGSDTQVRLLKDFVENAPVGTTFTLGPVTIGTCALSISDEKLADWFYNDFIYNRFTKNTYQNGFQVSNVVKKFNINPNIIFKGDQYLGNMPNMVYIEGFIEEDVTQTDENAGVCGFKNSGWIMLQNFPMWKVKDGATTGCLLPRPQGSTVRTNANFIFYSKNLERKYFCEFDANGTIIEDPTKYFLCNLPVQQYVSGQTIRFVTNTFWSLFTANEITEIERYIGLKNWGIIWQ